VRRAVPAKRAVPAERPVPAARCLAKQLAYGGGGVTSITGEVSGGVTSIASGAGLRCRYREAEAEQEAGADSQTSPRLRAEALAAEPRKIPCCLSSVATRHQALLDFVASELHVEIARESLHDFVEPEIESASVRPVR